MPLYEYKCGSCSDVIEVRQKFSDAPLTVCEKCGGPLERLLSAPALQFKGSGWYITDYARAGQGGAGKKKASEGGSASESSSSSSSTTPSGTDSKPAAPKKD